jgi:hypothetical protein
VDLPVESRNRHQNRRKKLGCPTFSTKTPNCAQNDAKASLTLFDGSSFGMQMAQTLYVLPNGQIFGSANMF